MANSSSDKRIRVRVCVCVFFFLGGGGWRSLFKLLLEVMEGQKTFVKKYGNGTYV